MEAKGKAKMGRRSFIATALAVVMAFSMFALPLSASAAQEGVGYAPDEYELLWYADDSLDMYAQGATFWQAMPIDGVPWNFMLGFNTIQEIVIKGSGANQVYRITPHPQYFPDVDDPSTAQWVLEIYSILVNGQEYLIGGYADIPTSYTQYNSLNEPYVVCTVRANIIYVGSATPRPDPDVINVQWAPAYFKIPAGV